MAIAPRLFGGVVGRVIAPPPPYPRHMSPLRHCRDARSLVIALLRLSFHCEYIIPRPIPSHPVAVPLLPRPGCWRACLAMGVGRLQVNYAKYSEAPWLLPMGGLLALHSGCAEVAKSTVQILRLSTLEVRFFGGLEERDSIWRAGARACVRGVGCLGSWFACCPCDRGDIYIYILFRSVLPCAAVMVAIVGVLGQYCSIMQAARRVGRATNSCDGNWKPHPGAFTAIQRYSWTV